MEKILEGKIAFITGAGRGIGRALALGFADLGAKCILTARTPEQLNETLKLLQDKGYQAIAVPADVAIYDQVKKVVDEGIKTYGRIDILINNAGYSRLKMISRMKVEDFTSILNTNVLGVYNCTHAVVPSMIEKGGGSIINTGSVIINYPGPRWSAYAMSKASLVGFTEALGEELKPQININTIMPSYVDTPLLHMGMKDEDVAKLNPIKPESLVPWYAFLASADGKKITGMNINLEWMLAICALVKELPPEQQPSAQWEQIESLVTAKMQPEQVRQAKKCKKLINFVLHA
jgi:3-oxoacyl-[acyl-carrier protein] reductase